MDICIVSRIWKPWTFWYMSFGTHTHDFCSVYPRHITARHEACECCLYQISPNSFLKLPMLITRSQAMSTSTSCCTTLPTLSIDRDNRSQQVIAFFKVLKANNCQPWILAQACQSHLPLGSAANSELNVCASRPLENHKGSALLLCPLAGLSAWLLSLSTCADFASANAWRGEQVQNVRLNFKTLFLPLLPCSSDPTHPGSAPVFSYRFLLF